MRHLIFTLYTHALRFYPRAFRERYAAEMLATARQHSADTPSSLRFAASLTTDTLRSLIEVHMRSAAPPSPAFVITFAAFFSAILLTISVFHQQLLRRAADHAPQQLVATLSSQMASGDTPSLTLPAPTADLASPTWLKSTSTFAAIYDANANLIASNATLNGGSPRPPQGVFSTIHIRGNDSVTWQPQRGVRIALTGREVPGHGFVLAGQSLLNGEARTARFNLLLKAIWSVLALACFALIALTRNRVSKLNTSRL